MVSMNMLLAIAFGGAVGAVGRYLSMAELETWLGAAFPFGTLAVNVLGSMLLGGFVELSALVWSPAPEIRAMLVVGVLGSFTTFSAFSLDVITLYLRGEFVLCGGYILASVILAVVAVFAGMHVVRWCVA